MNRMPVLLLLWVIFLPAAYASQIESPAAKREFYKGCYPSCIDTQRNYKENKFLLPVPFVLESYCSCACTRAAMRADKAMLERIGAAALQGRDLEEDKSIVQFMESHSAPCIDALFK